MNSAAKFALVAAIALSPCCVPLGNPSAPKLDHKDGGGQPVYQPMLVVPYWAANYPPHPPPTTPGLVASGIKTSSGRLRSTSEIALPARPNAASTRAS